MGQGLSVGIDDLANQCLCKVYIKPWLFSEKKVSQNLEVDSSKTEIYWDLTNARFGYGLELVEGFYKLGLSPSNLEIPNHKESLKVTKNLGNGVYYISKRKQGKIEGVDLGCSSPSLVPSLRPPHPRSPPVYPDLYCKL
uniref:Uncharacterized protein n=1 Tax=Quercus lobata TaxID=97700 RepID=A0A7N2LPG3_QUELO